MIVKYYSAKKRAQKERFKRKEAEEKGLDKIYAGCNLRLGDKLF